MKYIKNRYLISALAFVSFFACQPKDSEMDDFDIIYPKSEIASFSPTSAEVGAQVTLAGTNMDDAKLKVYIGNSECVILSQTATSVVVQLPRVIKTDYFSTFNSLEVYATSSTKLEVLYPESTIDAASISDTLFKAVAYTITGTNLDLITEVIFSDTTILIDGTKVTDPTKLAIGVKESNPLKPKFKATETVKFKCSANNELPSKIDIVVLEAYPSANLIVVDAKVASVGDEVKFIFDNFKNATLISSIKIGGVVAEFSFDEPYVLVTIPEGAVDGSIEIENTYKVKTTYASGLFLSVN